MSGQAVKDTGDAKAMDASRSAAGEHPISADSWLADLAGKAPSNVGPTQRVEQAGDPVEDYFAKTQADAEARRLGNARQAIIDASAERDIAWPKITGLVLGSGAAIIPMSRTAISRHEYVYQHVQTHLNTLPTGTTFSAVENHILDGHGVSHAELTAVARDRGVGALLADELPRKTWKRAAGTLAVSELGSYAMDKVFFSHDTPHYSTLDDVIVTPAICLLSRLSPGRTVGIALLAHLAARLYDRATAPTYVTDPRIEDRSNVPYRQLNDFHSPADAIFGKDNSLNAAPLPRGVMPYAKFTPEDKADQLANRRRQLLQQGSDGAKKPFIPPTINPQDGPGPTILPDTSGSGSDSGAKGSTDSTTTHPNPQDYPTGNDPSVAPPDIHPGASKPASPRDSKSPPPTGSTSSSDSSDPYGTLKALGLKK